VALHNFIERMELEEPFDYDAHFIFVGRKKGQLQYVNAFRLEEIEGQMVPRFIHILLDPALRRSQEAVDMLKQSEHYLQMVGYDHAFAYIPPENRQMRVLAEKFGYQPNGAEDAGGRYYWRTLGA
jgi:RimJ/RimL family protein N-acetyltransferase